MSNSEAVYVFIQTNPEAENPIYGASVKRIAEALEAIRIGKKPTKIYNTKNNN